MISLSELERLEKEFYMQDTLIVAKELLGKYLVKKTKNGIIGGMIVETEAYIGPMDDAAHSFNFRKTKRNEAMYEEGGIAYVYQIYGMHHCLNVVTNKKDNPEAVLIRAIEPIFGIENMQKNRKTDIKNLTNGPAKLCKAMDIDKRYNKHSFLSDDFFIAQTQTQQQFEIGQTKRINIEYATNYKNKPWRFIIKNNPYVSR